MALKLLQSTAITVRIGPFVTSDGTTNAGLTITQASIWVCKNEAAFAVKNDATACTAESLASGWYGCVLDGTDTGNPGNLIIWCEYSGVLPVWHEFEVVSAKQPAMYTQLIAQAASTALTAYDAPTKAEVDTVVQAHSASLSLTAYDPPTKAEMDALAASTALAAYTGVSTALAAWDVATPVWAALRADHTTSSSFGALIPSGIQKNKALSDITFLWVDSTDHRTPKTGLTSGVMAVYVSKDGAAYGAAAGDAPEEIGATGTYQFDATAADMNGNKVTFRFTATGADDTFVTFYTIKTVSG